MRRGKHQPVVPVPERVSDFPARVVVLVEGERVTYLGLHLKRVLQNAPKFVLLSSPKHAKTRGSSDTPRNYLILRPSTDLGYAPWQEAPQSVGKSSRGRASKPRSARRSGGLG